MILLFNENSVRCLRLFFIWAYFLFFLGEKFKEEVKNLDEALLLHCQKNKQPPKDDWASLTVSILS